MQRIVIFAFLFIGITLAAVAAPAEVETLTIAMQTDDFQQTTAHVTNQYSRQHPKGPPTEVVEFDYKVDGRTYHGDNYLTQFDDSRADIDSQIRYANDEKYMNVYYSPEQPERVVIHRDIGLMVPIGVLGVTAICLYGGISGFVEDRRSRREEARRQQQKDEALT
jgi:hypothetical protein